MNDAVIGHVTGVHGFRVKVDLDASVKSPVRADLDGCYTAIAINSYLTFPIGAGEVALGIVTDLDAWESFDPTKEEATLELVRPRRLATVQLLGTVRQVGVKPHQFDPGISILPTLDTPVLLAKRDVLNSVFREAPKRNRPFDHDGASEFDVGLRLGTAIGVPGQQVLGSYNDLLSRPLAVVGNTGSGKSCSVCHIVQEARKERSAKRARIFVLDINGEYATAFAKASPTGGLRPNSVYVNGKEFGIPVWLMSAFEVCEWLSASEQTQQPTLVNLWSIAKAAEASTDEEKNRVLRNAIDRIDQLHAIVKRGGPYKGKNAAGVLEAFKSFGVPLESATSTTLSQLAGLLKKNIEKYDSFEGDEAKIVGLVESLRDSVRAGLSDELPLSQQSADKPTYFPLKTLTDPAALFEAAGVEHGDNSLRQFLRGLQLRLGNRLQDRRWSCFFNYEQTGLKVTHVAEWLHRLGIGKDGDENDDVCVIDCSMLGHEVLPYVCGIIGRILLEVREHAAADSRFHEPWVIVVEEAHNYVRPRQQDEDRGVTISRNTFERIAKEGRKFGLSLIVASQRPRDISPTVLSQCANFVIHRLQNPDDIEHFRSVVPSQSKRLLDQVTILSAGEAIVIGSAFHIPSRVQIQLPTASPSSQSSTPHVSWHADGTQPRFDLNAALSAWGLGTSPASDGPRRASKK